MESFQELELPDFLRRSLKQMNFAKPTPVQAQAIPPALTGKDVIASAQTGTGKTAAFGIPLLAYLSTRTDKAALIMTPTRELAIQVKEVLDKLSGHSSNWGSVLLIGGANMDTQFKILSRKPRLIIGTPGRIIDHLNRGSLNLGQVGFLVLDEADRMLDMGFAPQLDKIRERLTGQRQTLLFSATLPSDIQAMGAKYLKDPVRISVGEVSQPVTKIAQMVIHTSEAKKPEELFNELKQRQGSILVFARTQHRVDRIAERLKAQGIKVTRIHGGRTQSQRKQAIEHFREGHYLVLVATDIAARGLDIHHIAHVINYDLPRNPEDYIHRVGRTARAGAEGSSLCFLTQEDKDLWNRILRLMGPSKATIENKPSMFGDFTPKPSAQPQRQHQGGPRPGQQPRHTHKPHSHSKPQHRQERPFDQRGGQRNFGAGNSQERRPAHSPQGHDRNAQFDRPGQKPGGFHKGPRPQEQRHQGRERFKQDRFGQGRDRNDSFIFHGKDDEHHHQQRRYQGGEVDGNRGPQSSVPNAPLGFIQNLKARFSRQDKGQRHGLGTQGQGRPAHGRDDRRGGDQNNRRFHSGKPHPDHRSGKPGRPQRFDQKKNFRQGNH